MIVGHLQMPSAGGGETYLRISIDDEDLKRALREAIEAQPSKACGFLEAIRAGLRAVWVNQTQSAKELAKASKTLEKARERIFELMLKEGYGSKKWKDLENIRDLLHSTEYDLLLKSRVEY
jgi:DNA repair photolyase